MFCLYCTVFFVFFYFACFVVCFFSVSQSDSLLWKIRVKRWSIYLVKLYISPLNNWGCIYCLSFFNFLLCNAGFWRNPRPGSSIQVPQPFHQPVLSSPWHPSCQNASNPTTTGQQSHTRTCSCMHPHCMYIMFMCIHWWRYMWTCAYLCVKILLVLPHIYFHSHTHWHIHDCMHAHAHTHNTDTQRHAHGHM